MSPYRKSLLQVWLMVGIPAVTYVILLVGWLVTRR